jgi:hypothetical protein
MAKLSLRVFKKGKPIYWIGGAVIVFVLFYMLFNRGAGSAASGGTTVVSTGPSEAMQMAGLQASTAIATANIGAGVEAARIAAQRDSQGLQAQIALAQLVSGERVALETLEYQRAMGTLSASNELKLNEQNITYALESARVAGETTMGLRKMEMDMFSEQLATNAAMFAIQSENLITQSMIAQVSSLKSKDRDTALAAIIAAQRGVAFSGGSGDDRISFAAAPVAYLPAPRTSSAPPIA